MGKLTKLLLNPNKIEKELIKSYNDAINNAKELYIASAYLTSWSKNIQLNSNCNNLLFLVGTDFGITRKKACADVVRWLPKKFYGSFLAVPTKNAGGFHPKILAWKDSKNKYHCIIGSSNLTEAAFNSNYEANIEATINKIEFGNIKNWLEKIASGCQVIDDDWIAQYKEKIIKRGGWDESPKRVINLPIPNSNRYQNVIADARKREKLFAKIKAQHKRNMVLCLNRKITNKEFWNKFWNLWYYNLSKMQGQGIQFKGKSANWRMVCRSFLEIVDNAKYLNLINLDHIVQDEIDNLKRRSIPVRGAWFSEMLCHFFPKYYPLLNNPIKIYLKEKKWKSRRGLSEGGKYIDLAKKLREAIKQNENGPKNMPELDAVIWRWCKEKKLLKNLKYGN